MSEAERRIIRLLGDSFVKAFETSITAARLKPELREMRALLDRIAQEDAYRAVAQGQSSVPAEGYYCDACGSPKTSVVVIMKRDARMQICFGCLKENSDAQESIGNPAV